MNIATDRLYCVLQESKTDEEEVSQTQDTESSSEASDRSFGETDGEDEHWDSFEEFTGAIDIDGDQKSFTGTCPSTPPCTVACYVDALLSGCVAILLLN